METTNNLKMKYWRRKVIQATGLLAFSFAVLISCQKKNDSGTVYATPAPINQVGLTGNCPGCTFAQVQIGTPTSRYGSYLTIQWDLIGDQTAAQQLVASGLSIKNYTGPIAARGVMSVTQALTLGYSYGYGGYGCQLAVGQYQLNTLQVGQASQGSFSLPQIEAVGGNGMRMVFSLTSAVVADPQGAGSIGHIFGQLVPVAAVYNGQQIACNDPGFYLAY